jgi:RNA polymerase sigma-70 factor (ECF subfamily)
MVSHLKQGRLQGTGRAGSSVQRRSACQEKLAGIYDQYYQPIYSYVYRRVSDVETASDLTAEVFHRLLRVAQGSDFPKQQVRAWLYRTAHNLVIDHYRRQANRQHLSLEEELVEGGEDPASVVERRASAAQVRAALQHLTSAQQQVIVLKFLQGLSNQEVAEILHRSVGAIKLLQHRALAALQRRLAPDEEKVRV